MLLKMTRTLILHILVALTLIFNEISDGQAQITHQWCGEKWLGESYLFKWKTDAIKKSITIRTEVMTKGWVGFGFSKHGETREVDLVIGWVDDIGQSSFNDFWVDEQGSRSLDKSEDWHLLSAVENATHTALEFRRNYVTCDTTNDLEIYENEWQMSHIVFSYSFLDPDNNALISDPAFESVLEYNFFGEENKPKETDIEEITFLNNFTIPPSGKPQVILCHLMKNDVKDKRMIVKFEPLIYPSYLDIGELNHHTLIYGCPKGVDQQLIKDHLGSFYPCYSKNPEHHRLTVICDKLLVVNNVLSKESLTLPDSVGILFDPEQSPYLLMETHLINKINKTLDLSIGIRTWMTRQLRNFEAVSVGFNSAIGFHVSNWGFIIPPKRQNFLVTAVLNSYCFDKSAIFEKNGIHIFAVYAHSHQAKYFELRHYRKERLNRVLAYNQYNYRHQPYRVLKEFIHFLKGDKLVVICGYDSLNQTKSHTSPYEHCNLSAYYYPRIDSFFGDGFIWSRLSYDTMLKITGVERIEGYDESIDSAVIRSPQQYNNTKLIDFIQDNRYQVENPKVLQEIQASADRNVCCAYRKKLPCQRIRSPPYLSESLDNQRPQNSCTPGKGGDQGVANNGWKEKLKKMKLSFRVLMNSFKLSFDFEKNSN